VAALANASLNWSDQFVAYLLSKGADPNAGELRDPTSVPLPAALLTQDANQRIPRFKGGKSHETGETAAQMLGRFRRTVALLLDAGADPMRPGYYGKIPFQRACYWGETEMVRHMIRKGARPNVAGPSAPGGFYGSSGYTALHCAVLRDSADTAATVRLLLASGADRNAKDDLGRTPLQLARHKGNKLVAKALGG
jgi:ankyrin repeat protein